MFLFDRKKKTLIYTVKLCSSGIIVFIIWIFMCSIIFFFIFTIWSVFLFLSWGIRYLHKTQVFSVLLYCYQWQSCLSCEIPIKVPMELAEISNYHHRRPHGGSNSGPFDPKLNALTTRPRIHDINEDCYYTCSLSSLFLAIVLKVCLHLSLSTSSNIV